MGNLTVILFLNKVEKTPLKKLTGVGPDAWQLAWVTIPNISSSYSIMFQAVLGNQYTSDIAIDDISFNFEKSCEQLLNIEPSNKTAGPGEYQCLDKSIIKETKLCDGVDDCVSGEDEMHKNCSGDITHSF